MNQPKFKFGDKVRLRDSLRYDTDPWVIAVISLMNNEPKYSDSESSLFKESELELYQEPQKKKLYAFEDAKGRVFFALDEPCFVGCRPLPEYDIEYSSSEQTEALSNILK